MQGEKKRVCLQLQRRTLRDFENDLKGRRSLLGWGLKGSVLPRSDDAIERVETVDPATRHLMAEPARPRRAPASEDIDSSRCHPQIHARRH